MFSANFSCKLGLFFIISCIRSSFLILKIEVCGAAHTIEEMLKYFYEFRKGIEFIICIYDYLSLLLGENGMHTKHKYLCYTKIFVGGGGVEQILHTEYKFSQIFIFFVNAIFTQCQLITSTCRITHLLKLSAGQLESLPCVSRDCSTSLTPVTGPPDREKLCQCHF